MIKEIRLMVVSLPCHQPVNRSVYRELAERHGVTLHLVAPRRLNVGGKWRDTPSGSPAPYELTLLEINGPHPRLQRMHGLEDLARKWKPTHLLVDHDPASLMTRQAAAAGRGAKIWAMTAENLMPHYTRDFMAGLKALKPSRMVGPALTWALRDWVHPIVDRVFTLSSDGTRVMEALGFQGKATQIPLGFDPELFHVQSKEKIEATRGRLGLHRPTVAYFGRLTPEKGVHLLMDALASIKDLPWQFLLDHFSDYETNYTVELKSRIATLGISDRVVYFDAKHEEMPAHMNAADIVVLPSLSTPKWKEQYGRVLPEAMACGKVVVGSDSGAIPELVAGHGRIFPEGNVRMLAAVLHELLTMDAALREEMGRSAAAYAQENLSIKRQAEIWAGLLS